MNYLKKLLSRKKPVSVPSEALEEDSPLVLNLAGVTQRQLDLMFKYGKASNRLGKYESKPFTDLPYGVVRKDLLTLQRKNLHPEAIMLIFECQYPDVKLKGITQNDIISFMIWVKEQQQKLYNREKLYLSTDPDLEYMAAGIRKLDEFGALATIHTLANRDILKHKDIEALPYYKVYEVLKLDKVNAEIQKAYNEIIKAKHKNNTK